MELVDEALRYLGIHQADDPLRRQMAELVSQAQARCMPRYVWRASPVEQRAEGMWLKDVQLLLPGTTAKTMLIQCRSAAVLVCTLGASFDGWLRQLQAKDMAQAVMLDACGSALVEAGCDAAQEEIRARHPGMYLTDRFSPGYGDLPLALQPLICQVTDAQRRVGVHVAPSCLMNPQKSVTALIGLAEMPQRARIRGCAYCSMRETCSLRKGGRSCEI